MTSARTPPPPDRLPTLTEVVELAVPQSGSARPEAVQPVQTDAPGPHDVAGAMQSPSAPSATVEGALDDEQLVDDVLDAVHRRIDLLYEYRVREALAPAMSEAADRLVREIRDVLAETVRDVVSRAVTEELDARRRSRE